MLVPDAVLQHRYVLNITPEKLYHLEVGRSFLLRKHFTPWELVRLLPSLIAAEALAWAKAFQGGFRGIRAKARACYRGWMTPVEKRAWEFPLNVAACTVRTIPFGMISRHRLIHAAGALVNLVFVVNRSGKRHPFDDLDHAVR